MFNNPDYLLALMLVDIAGVGDVQYLAPWFPDVDTYVQKLLDDGFVADGDTTNKGRYVLGEAWIGIKQ